MPSHHEQTPRPMSIYEREVEEAHRLKEWYQTVDWDEIPPYPHPEIPDQLMPARVKAFIPINNIYWNMTHVWAHNPVNYQHDPYGCYSPSIVLDLVTPPPWEPKLKDVQFIREEYQYKLLDILNITRHVLHPNIDIPERNNVVSSLEEPLEAWHIRWIQMLIEENGLEVQRLQQEERERDREIEEDRIYTVAGRAALNIHLHRRREEDRTPVAGGERDIPNEHEIQVDNNKHKQELSREGLSIVEKIMEEQKLGEGDYLMICNIFKELYK